MLLECFKSSGLYPFSDSGSDFRSQIPFSSHLFSLSYSVEWLFRVFFRRIGLLPVQTMCLSVYYLAVPMLVSNI